ncbi:MAG: SDR family NAD(P)-dependent oxidoreductase [Alphaproteobacteria bacterium]
MSAHAYPLVWITGASKGIGRALAIRFARAGSTVAASARSADALAVLARDAESLPGRVVPLPLDVTDAAAVAAALGNLIDAEGLPDLVVMNAGTHIPVDGMSPTSADFKALLDLNVMGTVHVLEAVVPRMVARRAGRLAIVASIAGYRGLRTASAYGASKAALINMSEALRVELADAGVVLQLVNPGFVDTPLTEENEFPMPFLMSADKAAERFYRGLHSSRFEITFPKRFTWILKALRLLPYCLYLPLAGAAARQRPKG